MSKLNLYKIRLEESEEMGFEDLDSLTDEELVPLSKDGSELATEILINRYKDLGLHIANKYFVQGMDKEDMYQEALVSLWQSINGFTSSKGTFYSYVSRTMNNRILDLLRTSNTKQAQAMNHADSLDRDVEYGEGDNVSFGSTLASDDQAIDDQTIENKNVETIYDFIQSDYLSDKERNILQHFMQGHSTQDIADMEDLTYKQVNNSLGRVRGKIRKHFPHLAESRSYTRSSVSIKIRIRG